MKLTNKEIIKALKETKTVYSDSAMMSIRGTKEKMSNGCWLYGVACSGLGRNEIDEYCLEADDWEIVNES